MRIRTIKPEFWESNDIADLELEDRLLFIGLWSYVDDHGRGRDEEHLIIASLFPRDMFAKPRETVARVSRGLSHLSAANLIVRYEVDGAPFLAITAWKTHQKVDRPRPSRYPAPPATFPQDDANRESVAKPRETVAKPREDVASGTGEQGNRGTGEELDARLAIEPVEKSSEHAGACHTSEDHPEPKPRSKRGTRLPTDWQPTPELRQWAIDNRPDLDVDAETEIFRDYWISKTGAQATKADWKATYRNWIRRAHSRPKKTSPGENPYYTLAAQYAQEGR